MPSSLGQLNKLWGLVGFKDDGRVARRRDHDPFVERNPDRVLCTRLEIVHSAGVVLVAGLKEVGVGALAFLLVERKGLGLVVGPALGVVRQPGDIWRVCKCKRRMNDLGATTSDREVELLFGGLGVAVDDASGCVGEVKFVKHDVGDFTLETHVGCHTLVGDVHPKQQGVTAARLGALHGFHAVDHVLLAGVDVFEQDRAFL